MSRPPSSLEARALSLLGSGVAAEQVAAALGCSPSRISQLLSEDEFAAEVTSLRYSNLAAHNLRDARYDTLEDKLTDKLENTLPLMFKPIEILRSLQIVNALKRRGQAAPEQITNQQTIVNITIPTIAVTKFVTNIHNQVIQAGSQELLTIQSGTLLKQMKGEQDDSIRETVKSRTVIGYSQETGAGRQEASLRTKQEESSSNLISSASYA